jgi:phosphoribosylglycinamide formyltransferase-1
VQFSIVVLASGSGSLFQALIDAPNRGTDFDIAGLITDNPNAKAIERAAKAGIQIAVLPLADFPDRDAWNQAVADAANYFSPDLLVSAGFMRVLAEPVITDFAGKFINTHPALLPKFPGAHAVRDAIAAGVNETGSTVHFVDAGVDTGPVITQKVIPVFPTDTEAELHERIKIVERELLLEVVTQMSKEKSKG